MKKIVLLAVLMSVAAAQAKADEMPLNTLDIGLGAAIPTSANNFNQVASQGGALDLEYFRRVAPAIDLGLGLTGLGFGDKTVVSNTLTATAKTGGSILAIRTHFHPWPGSKFSPYLAGGIGISGYSEKVDATPNPGFVWANTGTRETRRVLDDKSNGLATQLGLGIQANFTRHFFGAVEGNWYYLTIDKDKFGASSVQAIEAGAKAGWRF